jgi:hypothetical protein
MSLPASVPLTGGRIGYDVHDFLVVLGDADLLQVNWPENGTQRGMDVFAPPLPDRPDTLVLSVRNRSEAFALRVAKMKIDQGDYHGAYLAMHALTDAKH